MTKKDKIILFYYEENKNIIVISEELKVSKQYVSKIIKRDDRYLNEKKKRKEQSKERRKILSREYSRKNRENSQQRIDASLDVLHRQASIELSTRKTISNRAFRNWNSSIYEYHSRTKEYRIKENMKNKISYAIPKKIKWE